jgi:transcriptional regulator
VVPARHAGGGRRGGDSQLLTALFVPEHYRQGDQGELLEAMRANAFATIISADARGAPSATWIPFLIEGTPERPVIYGHMARANDQWRSWTAQTPLLALFQGPHHYISPSWYEPAPHVPTWNYVAVQVRARPRLLEDDVEVEAMLERLVEQFESERPTPWELGAQPADYRARQAAAIVGFELMIEEITGAWKLSQRAGAGDRAGAIAGLRAEGGDQALAIAALMGG